MPRSTLLVCLALSVVVSACGGDGGTPPGTPPPPPPPPAPAATSIAVVEGNGQSIAAGDPAPVAPAVVVRNAAGNPVAGATVTFAVTAGGGTLEGASQTTSATGIARVGRWTMGPAGAQQISATVGTLAPATIDAQLVPGTEILVNVVPTQGGELKIAVAGHPYNGLKLVVPPGTFPTPVNWTLRVRPNTPPPALPAGYRVGGPMLEIATDAPRGSSLMTLEVPVRRQPGESVVLVMVDPARGAIEVMPTVGITDSSIRVVTKHLRGDMLLGRRNSGSALRASPFAAVTSIGGMIPLIISALPQPPVPPVLNPATQGWPVLDNGSAAVPNGFGSTLPAFGVLSAISQNAALVVKGLSEPGTYADAGILGAVQSAAQNPGIDTQGLQSFLAQFNNMPKSQRDDLVAQASTADLAITGKPGLMAMFKSGTGPTDTETWFTNTIASDNSGLTTTQSTTTGTGLLSKIAAGFNGLSVKSTNDGPASTADGALPMSSFVFDFDQVSPFHDMVNGYNGLSPQDRRTRNTNLANLLNMQKPTLETEAVPGTGFAPETGGTIAVRSGGLLSRVANGIGKFIVHDDAGVEQGRSDGTGPGLNLGGLVGQVNGMKSQGTLSTFDEVLVNKLRQMFPQAFELERARFTASPDSVRITTDSTTVTFEADVPSPPPGGFRVRWDWGDGQKSEGPGLTTGTHTYAQPGNYTVTVTLLSADGTRVLSEYTVQAKGDASPHWRLTSFINQDALDEPGLPIAVLLQNAVGSPGSTMIAVDPGSGNSTELRLRQLPNGSWDANNCCSILGTALPGETRVRLGVTPTQTVVVGSHFAGYGISRFTQGPDLDAGAMSSQNVIGTRSYFVPGIGVQVGPTFVMRLEGTRSGTLMTGTITFTLWEEGNTTPPPVGQAEHYRFPFTAVRIK